MEPPGCRARGRPRGVGRPRPWPLASSAVAAALLLFVGPPARRAGRRVIALRDQVAAWRMTKNRLVHPVSVVAGSIDTASWRGLPDPWRRCFTLAWQSRLAGSVPVGAVVVDRHGEVVAEGRNRFGEQAAPAGQLAGTALGHAELNALAQLAPGSYEQHVLYTSLEPCLLCTAALTHTHVGQVRFAAADPLWRGLQRLPQPNKNIPPRGGGPPRPLSPPPPAW